MKDKERIEQMTTMKLDGETYQAIGKQFNLSRQRVQQLLEPPAFIRKLVYERAEGRCESCGILVGVRGHIHHKGNGDYDYQNIENLQLLCPSCHRLIHSGDHKTEMEEYYEKMNTKAIGIRVPVILLEEINRRATWRGVTFNRWINWAVVQGLRSHKKKDK